MTNMVPSLLRRSVLLITTLLVSFSPHVSADELVFNTEEYPPFNFSNSAGETDGLSTRLLEAALEDANLSATFRILPWARAYTEARLRGHHCVYSTARTPERQYFFQWVGPLVETDWAAFALADSNIHVTGIEELEGLRVGSFREDAVGHFVKNQGIPILLAAADRENILRLEAGLIDVWVSSETVAKYIAADTGIAVKRLFTFNRVHLYLACHPSVPKEVVSQLQSSLDTLRAEGRDERIRERVLEQWRWDP